MSKKTIENSETRKQIITAATQLFADNGFEAVSIRQIAQATDTNIALVSYYFGSKEGLFQEILNTRYPEAKQMLQDMNAADITPIKKLYKAINFYTNRIFDNPNFNKIMLREMSLMQRPEHARMIVDGIYPNMQLVIGFIHEGQEKGDFKKNIDAELTWISIISTIFQMLNNKLLAKKICKLKSEEDVYSKKMKKRVKTHLKAMLSACILKKKKQKKHKVEEIKPIENI